MNPARVHPLFLSIRRSQPPDTTDSFRKGVDLFETRRTTSRLRLSKQKKQVAEALHDTPTRRRHPPGTGRRQAAGKRIQKKASESKRFGGLNEGICSWSGKRDSNSRPQPWQGCALPTELFPQSIRRTYVRFSEEEETRTPTSQSTLPPQSSASTNSATSPFPHRLYFHEVPRTGLEPARHC